MAPTCPLSADFLPSPLDVNNFALDLDKSEEKVLLPCSRCAAWPGFAGCCSVAGQ